MIYSHGKNFQIETKKVHSKRKHDQDTYVYVLKKFSDEEISRIISKDPVLKNIDMPKPEDVNIEYVQQNLYNNKNNQIDL